MKKIYSMLFLIGCAIMSHAQNLVPLPPAVQCIVGPTTITVGQTVTFTSGNTAQCTSCYDWDINGIATSFDNQTAGTVKIVNSDMNQSVSIQGVSAGTFSLQLTFFDETGCHSCNINGTVVSAPANCCAPSISGWFECRGSGSGHEGGSLTISNSGSGCTVDWSAISQITIDLSGAIFSGSDYGLSSITLNAPFTGGTIVKPIYGDSPLCAYGNNFGAFVTFYYNNGCAPVQKSGYWYNYNTPVPINGTDQKINNLISVSPNPATSVLKFEGKDLSKYRVSFFDTNGNEVLKQSRLQESLNISGQKNGVYIYIITDESGYRQQGKIIKK